MTLSVAFFWCLILFNDFTTKHIVESQNWDSMSEKSVVKLVNSESTSYLKQLSAISAWDLTESCMLIAAGIFWVRVQTVEITGCTVSWSSLNQLTQKNDLFSHTVSISTLNNVLSGKVVKQNETPQNVTEKVIKKILIRKTKLHLTNPKNNNM